MSYMTEHEYLEWLVRYQHASRWFITWSLASALINTVNIVLLFSVDLAVGNFVLLALAFVALLAARHYHNLLIKLRKLKEDAK